MRLRPPARPSARGADVGTSLTVANELSALEQSGLRRELRETERLGGCRVRVEGREAVSFGSCDYLGLATHPRLSQAASRAALEQGAGAGAARLLVGHTGAVAALESELARVFGAPAALVFGSGYLANVGVITALAGEGDLVLSDALNHASTIDACRLSLAETEVFPHNDVDALRRGLERAGDYRRTLVVVEGLYSMDGDAAPLAEMAEAVRLAGAMLVVDDAHGLGVRGDTGRGSAAAEGVEQAVTVQIGNLGKALGSYGAFVLCPPDVRELLVQQARSFVFTCALPPSVVAAAREGVALLGTDADPLWRLRRNLGALHRELVRWGVPLLDTHPESPIVPVPVDGAEAALEASRELLARGWLVPAIRPPTVPEGRCRLRLTVTAAHEEADLSGVARDLGAVLGA